MTNRQNRRVAIVGLGAITPIGKNLTDYWSGLLEGRNGVGAITLFDASQHACQMAAEVKDFDPHQYLDKKDAKRMDRFAQFGVCASLQAIADAQLEINELNADRVGVSIGTGVGGLRTMEIQMKI